jgi:hypothetical protein
VHYIVSRPCHIPRYSTFLVLYPLGVFGELLSVYHALPILHAYATDPASTATNTPTPRFIQWVLLPFCEVPIVNHLL